MTHNNEPLPSCISHTALPCSPWRRQQAFTWSTKTEESVKHNTLKYSPRSLSVTVKYKQQQNAKASRFFPLDTDRKAHPQFQKVGTLCKIQIKTECKKGKCLFDVETHLRKEGHIRAHGISTLHIGNAPSILKDVKDAHVAIQAT